MKSWFLFLTGLFRKRQREREIFEFWDGSRQRRADPLVLWDNFWADEKLDPNADIAEASSGKDPEARAMVLDVIQRVFGVSQWTEQTPGLTIDEQFRLLYDFSAYMADRKKKLEGSPNESEHSESESSTSENSTTRQESDSISTPTESSDDEPQQHSKRSVRL